MRSPVRHSKRLDIQGLRAVAVLAVVANHLTGFPGGGFVGVDIFFVISGFVITLGLIREHEETSSISFKNFYFRRVARIMPAGTLAIVGTVIVGYFAFFNERAQSVLTDGVWAFLFSANWRFAVTGTDYWAEDSPISPLQHYWSLGVEEQFYFVWPLLALVVLGSAAKAGLHAGARRGVLVAVLAALVSLSFVWAVTETSTNASWAYFSTLSRAWELGVGALLAVAAPLFNKITNVVRAVMGWVGVAGIIVSIAIIEKSFAFPAPWAALPVTAVALVIIAGTGGSVPWFGFLTNSVSTYVGNTSYSLYLWHFPVIIMMGALWPAGGPTFYIVSVVLMGFLAVSSYEFIEVPAQRSLTAWRASGFRRSRQRKAKSSVDSGRFRYLGFATLVTTVIVVVPIAVHHSAPAQSTYMAVPAPAASASVPPADTSASRLSAQIETALGADVWPALTPSLGNLVAEGKPDEDGEGCGNTDLQKPDCIFGTDKAETIVVLGDSTGITLLPTVRTAMGENYNIRGMTKAGCVVLDLQFKKDAPEEVAECEAFKAAAITEINEIKPAMVLLTNTAGSHAELASEAPIGQIGAEWQGGTERLLESLMPSGADLIVVTAPPSGKSPADCATRTSVPRDCMYSVPPSFTATASGMLEATKITGAKFIDTRSWFCNEAGYCPAFVGETVVKRDSIHTTKQYAVMLAPVFKDALAS